MRKPKLYIIHGWTYTTAPWARTISLLEKKGIKVEMLQVPGLTTPSKKVWTIEDYTKWADRNIPDGSVALGHSNGGRILLNLCAEKPKKLEHLILLDAAGVYEISNKRDVVRTLSKKFGFLKSVPGLAKIWHKLTGSTDYARAPENMKRTLSNMLESDRSLDLSRVLVPTSILWGANDTVTPPHQAEIMHTRIVNSSLEIFPGWTHAPYLSHPVELAKEIYQAYTHPPELKLPTADDAANAVTATSATGANTAPNPPAKLVVRTDAEKVSASASLKKAVTNKTPDDVAATSASANIRKAQVKIPEVISSANPLSSKHETKSSQEENTSLLAELDEKSTEKVDFVPLDPTKVQSQPLPGAITSASVPKVSRIEKAKRKVKAATQKSKAKTTRKKT